ncbi:MAG TPA: hypothetical protein VF974_05630 [Patescibacteria group bacterium]
MKMKQKSLIRKSIIAWAIILSLVISAAGARYVQAASLTALSNTMTNQTISAASDHTIKFTTPTGVAAGQTITVTFPSGFGLSTLVAADFNLLSGVSTLTLAGTCTGTTWGVAVASQVITFTSCTGTIAATTVITVKIGVVAGGTHQITNNSSAASYSITIGGTFGDTGTITIQIVTNSVVAVSATVPQSLTFSISTNSIGFGTLSTSAVTYANAGGTGSSSSVVAHTLAAGTNAVSGYTITVQGATLTSGSNTIAAIGSTAAASAAGTAQFGLNATVSGGIGTVSSPYNGANYAYAATSSTSSAVGSASGSSATSTYSVTYICNIAAQTPAGSYTASLTYIGTANF